MNENILKFIEVVTPIAVAVIGVIGGRSAMNKKENKTKLISHPIYSRIDYNKTIINTHFTLENRGKEKVFKEILNKHLEIYKKYLTIFIEKVDTSEVKDTNELLTNSIDTLNSIVRDLSIFYLVEDIYTDQEKKVFDIVMSKYNHWNQSREQEILRRIDEIAGSVFYPDTYSKALAILDTYLCVVNDTISDASKTLGKINGDLKGLTFKGTVI